MSVDTLTECLSAVGLTELPDKWDGRGTWLRAIAKVRTIYGYQWAIVRQDASQEKSVIQSFGPSAAILEYTAIYPYQKINGKRRASIPTGKMREFFTNNGIDAEAILDTPAMTAEQATAKKEKIKEAIKEVEVRENDKRLSIDQRYLEHYNKSKEIRSNGNATQRKARQADKTTSVKRQRRKMG